MLSLHPPRVAQSSAYARQRWGSLSLRRFPSQLLDIDAVISGPEESQHITVPQQYADLTCLDGMDDSVSEPRPAACPRPLRDGAMVGVAGVKVRVGGRAHAPPSRKTVTKYGMLCMRILSQPWEGDDVESPRC
jgi:hypothetical protein